MIHKKKVFYLLYNANVFGINYFTRNARVYSRLQGQRESRKREKKKNSSSYIKDGKVRLVAAVYQARLPPQP